MSGRDEGSSEPKRAAVLIIGNEILSGRTRDANLPFLADRLNQLGVRVAEARIVADIEAQIVDALNALRGAHDFVLTTGGIGPTHDDITSASIAKAFGRPFGRNPEAERRLLAYYDSSMVNEARMRMADTPADVVLIDNPVSIAPGFRIENVWVLPGVPKIMQAMFEGIAHQFAGGPPIKSRALTVFCPEGEMAEPLATLQEEFKGLDLGSYPFYRQGRFGTTIVARGTDQVALEGCMEALKRRADAMGKEVGEYDAGSG